MIDSEMEIIKAYYKERDERRRKLYYRLLITPLVNIHGGRDNSTSKAIERVCLKGRDFAYKQGDDFLYQAFDDMYNDIGTRIIAEDVAASILADMRKQTLGDVVKNEDT